ncbi:myrosinase-binding protein 2 [Capsella rubella]|uniref:myrosinase-binding protein 2 n=1 Tax=Capsella rubella TaxID=81985 RepID=UPI000CD517E9|nr:myrosinase-binding protein 2 [Capsella rubella]
MSMFVDICGDPHKGETFDDGVYDGISKVTIGDHETYGVVYMKIEYIKDGDVVEKQHGNMRGEEITELGFETSRGRASQIFGMHPTKISTSTHSVAFHLGADGKKFAGLHGRAGDVIHALGGHFDMVSSAHTPMPSVPKGGNYGTTWDDGAYDEGVKKLWVGESDRHLSYIKFQYCNGDILVPSASQVGGFDCIKNLIFHSHGKEPPEAPKEFALLQDDEYITSVEGTYHDYDILPNVRGLTSLKFKTSYNRESPLFGKIEGIKFNIQGEGSRTKLVGLRGISDLDRLTALGGYFTVAPPWTCSVVKGGLYNEIGTRWDDGIHATVRKITVTSEWPKIYSIDLQYIDGDEHIIHHGGHGEVPDTQAHSRAVLTYTIELDDDDYVTSMEVGMSNYYGFLSIAMLKIKTNRGGAQVLGYDPTGSVKYAKRLLFKKRGHKIVGFFGRTSDFLEDIGVYFEPINDE